MATGWKRVHVFVSSTFNDMHAERDYLVKQVFPALREWCEQRKLRLVDVDLRWGVTEQDATYNRNVVNTCLNRIDDCRPFFVCFLGQRRGWVPHSDDVAEETFEAFPELAPHVGRASVTEMEILHALIDPFHASIPPEQRVKEDERYARAEHAFFYLRNPSYLDEMPSEPPLLRETYTNAGTDNPARDDAELARWRDVRIPDTHRPVHPYRAAWSPEASTPELMLPLMCPSANEAGIARWREQWLRARVAVTGLQANAEQATRFNERFTAGRLTDFTCAGDEPLADVLLRDLKEAIAQRHPDHVPVEAEDALQKEIDQQEEFLFINSEGFIERPGAFDDLDAYLEGDSRQLYVLTAEGGMGKSMLLANWIDLRRADSRNEKTAFVFRFVGQSDGSSSVAGLLRSIMLELQQVWGRIPKTKQEKTTDPDGRKRTQEVPLDIPQDPTEIHNFWREQMAHLGDRGKTVIVIDALNQLESGLGDLGWLPMAGIADDLKVIVSFRRGAPQSEAWIRRWQDDPNTRLAKVQPFESLDDRRKLVAVYLSQYLKELDEDHVETLINTKGAGNPLFLKVVLSELRVFGAYAQLGEKIRNEFGDDPVSAFQAVLRRLETDPAYAAIDPLEGVPLLFGLLAHSRRGLSVDELTGLFSNIATDCRTGTGNGSAATEGKTGTGNDSAATEGSENGACPRFAGTPNDARACIHLFLRQVSPFLAHREGRYDFFYESFKAAATGCYARETGPDFPMARPAAEWHGLLADYFAKQPNFTHCTIAAQSRCS